MMFSTIRMEDILASLSKQKHVFHLRVRKLDIQAYVDDVIVFCSTTEGLGNLIEISHTGCESHNMEINLGK